MTSKTTLIFIGSLIYLCVASLVLGLGIYKVHKAGKELQNRLTAISEQNAERQSHTALARILAESEEDRNAIDAFVLTERKTSEFLTEIESLGSGLGITMTVESLAVLEREGAVDDIKIEYALEGEDASVRKMLSILENLPYHSKVVAGTLSRGNDTITLGRLELVLSLRTYD